MQDIIERPSEEELEELYEEYGEPEILESEVKLIHLEYKGNYQDCKGEAVIAVRVEGDEEKVVGIRHRNGENFCLPMGRVWTTEDFTEGAKREAEEETGLEVELEELKELRKVTFKFSNAELERWMLLFEAEKTGGELSPKDKDEIAESKLVDSKWVWEKGFYALK